MSYKEDKDLEEGGDAPQAITTLIEEVYINKYTFTEEESRSLVRKLDWHILPYIWCTQPPPPFVHPSDYNAEIFI